MKISNEEHYKHNWKVHQLLSDFEVEDVWQLPVDLEEAHSIPQFQAALMSSLESLGQKGIAGWLFKLRYFLGSLFGWDKKEEVIAISPGSIRERYAKMEGLTATDLPAPGTADFIPVYSLDNESLAEIKNATVHAGLHLCKVLNKEKYTVQMAIYVKPNGILGRIYMGIIKPFRLIIVYPAMMKIVAKHWKKAAINPVNSK